MLKFPHLMIVWAAAVSAGCSAPDVEDAVDRLIDSPNKGPQLETVSMPRYGIGDSFSYDNGRIETVVAVDGDVVSWQNDRGFAYTAYRNSILPRLAWESRIQKSRLDDLTAPPDALWPLKVGNEARFSYSNTVVEKESGIEQEYGSTFDCRVAGTQKVTVPMGTFDTYRISCYRNKRSTGRYYGTRNWYYAPAISHYVLREDSYRSKKRPARRVALTSVMPSLNGLGVNGRQKLEFAVQNALENLPSGKAQAWSSTDGAYEGTVMPLRTYKTAEGIFCREYKVTVAAHGRTGSYERTACRTRKGSWQAL